MAGCLPHRRRLRRLPRRGPGEDGGGAEGGRARVSTPASSRLPDLWVGVFVLALGGLAVWQAASIPTSPIYAQVGPKAVPFVIAAGLLALGAALVTAALRGGWSWTLEEVQD